MLGEAMMAEPTSSSPQAMTGLWKQHLVGAKQEQSRLAPK
jgi:hypothetical protein